MIQCVMLFGQKTICSIFVDSTLIIKKRFTNVEDISSFLYGLKIERLDLVYQGTPVPMVPNDSIKIGDIFIHNGITPLVVVDRDVTYFTDLANTCKIPTVVCHNYLDFIRHKFVKYEDIIIVDHYLTDYCIIKLKGDKIEDFDRASKVQLSKKISMMKTKYQCGVISSADVTDYIGLNTGIENYKSIPERFKQNEYLVTLEPLVYFKDKDGIDVLKSKPKDNPSLWTDKTENRGDVDSSFPRGGSEKLPTKEENEELPFGQGEEFTEDLMPEEFKDTGKKPKNTVTFKPGGAYDKEKSKFLDTILTLGLVALLMILISGILFSIIYKGKVNLLYKEVQIKQETCNETLKNEKYLKGDDSKSPVALVSNVYGVCKDRNINSVSYSNGDLSVILLANNALTQADDKDTLQKVYKVTSSDYMGDYSSGGVVYKKTQYGLLVQDG